MSKLIKTDNEYKEWIGELKQRIRQSQIKAAVKVNTELLKLYCSIGGDIVRVKAEAKWGDGIIEQLSQDLKTNFPDMSGFSSRNLWYMKKWYSFYSQPDTKLPQVGAESKSEKLPQVVAEIEKLFFAVPWGHQRCIIDKIKNIKEAVFYINKTVENGWSRNMLLNMIESSLYYREGASINNFSSCLPASQSSLAQELTKDPYNFDFLTLRDGYLERELEDALTDNITKFLIELGNGFAYVGRQVRLEVGGDEFFIDLLFYHLKLRSYVVIELKTGDFQPEYIGKLGFYVSAINHEMKLPQDNPTIGLLICKSKNNIVARYTLDTANLPSVSLNMN